MFTQPGWVRSTRCDSGVERRDMSPDSRFLEAARVSSDAIEPRRWASTALIAERARPIASRSMVSRSCSSSSSAATVGKDDHRRQRAGDQEKQAGTKLHGPSVRSNRQAERSAPMDDWKSIRTWSRARDAESASRDSGN